MMQGVTAQRGTLQWLQHCIAVSVFNAIYEEEVAICDYRMTKAQRFLLA